MKNPKNNFNTKGTAKRAVFLKYYFSEEIDGKKNPYFSNAYKSAKKVGYSKTYAKQILGRITKQNNPAGESLVKVRKDLSKALLEKGVDTDWLANLVYKLGNKTDKKIIDKKLIDTGDPDSQGARTALDFVAKTQGLYEPETIIGKFSSYTKEQLIEFILSKVTKNG